MTVKNGKKKNKMAFAVMSLRKPTALDKLMERVPKPEGAVPNFGLPKWKELPLESKIPMVPGPKDAYVLSRKKLGEKLWVQTKDAEFNTSDPYNYEFEQKYDSLHDEHLSRYFSNDHNRQRLLELGFINEDLDAICTLKDYNMYRKFLKKLHNDSINKEIKHVQNVNDQRRVIAFTDHAAKKEIERLKKEERKKLAKRKLREELRQMKEKMKKERKEAAEKLKKRMESIERAKEEEKKNRVMKLRAQTERARQKRAAISEMDRDRTIQAVMRWARKEAKRKKMRKERLDREAEEKRIRVAKAWERKRTSQISEMSKNEEALQFAQDEREKFIKSYMDKVQKARNRFQKRVENYHKFLTCYLNRQMTGKKTCCIKSKKAKGKKSPKKLSPQSSIRQEIVENNRT